MLGKQKCKALKEIRKQIADENDIPYVVSKCEYQGECSGTCPKCEEELQYLENELEKRRKRGKIVAIAGISIGVCVAATTCAGDKAKEGMPQLFDKIETNELSGAILPIDTPDTNDNYKLK